MLNNSPYDLAAAALILEEAGAVVTDAYGAPLADRRLLGSGAEFQISCVARVQRRSSTRAICAALDAGSSGSRRAARAYRALRRL